MPPTRACPAPQPASRTTTAQTGQRRPDTPPRPANSRRRRRGVPNIDEFQPPPPSASSPSGGAETATRPTRRRQEQPAVSLAPRSLVPAPRSPSAPSNALPHCAAESPNRPSQQSREQQSPSLTAAPSNASPHCAAAPPPPTTTSDSINSDLGFQLRSPAVTAQRNIPAPSTPPRRHFFSKARQGQASFRRPRPDASAILAMVKGHLNDQGEPSTYDDSPVSPASPSGGRVEISSPLPQISFSPPKSHAASGD